MDKTETRDKGRKGDKKKKPELYKDKNVKYSTCRTRDRGKW